MDPKLTKIFCDFQIEPRPHLCADICHVIVLREKRDRQIKFFGYTIIATVSLVAIVPASISLVNQLGQSGFGHYASLAASDAGILTGYWKQFAVILVESIPGVSLALVLGITLVLGWSARNAIKQTKPLSIMRRYA
jgi:predicted nucleic acid-binding Zn ribbon protein